MRAAGLLVGLALATSACGSTVAGNAGGGTAAASGALTGPAAATGLTGGAADAGSAPGATVAGPGAVAGGAAASSTGGSQAGPQAFGPGAPAGAGGTGSAQQPGAAVAGGGPGVTATTMSVGVAIADDAKAANTALGAGAVTSGDEQSEYRAKVADLNQRGGIAGRKVLLVEYHYDVTNGATTEAIEQQACSYFTEDHKVAAVINVALTDNGLACLTHKGVAVFGGSLSYSTDRTYAEFPRYVEPIGLSLTRVTTNYADGLENMKYFGPAAKVGLVTYDNPRFARATAQLRAALARHGRKIDDVAAVKFPEKQSDLSQEGADVSSAVLRFRSDGITHVLFLDPSAVSELLFLNNAESQGYRPRYGFGQSGAAALRSTGVAAAQFVGSVTVGWFPRLDGVPPPEAQYPPAEKACLTMFSKSGITFDSDNARRHAADICDSFDYLRSTVASLTGPINADSIVQAARGLGAQPGAGTYRLHVGPHRNDGVDLVRYNAYAADCDCWHYLGGVRAAA